LLFADGHEHGGLHEDAGGGGGHIHFALGAAFSVAASILLARRVGAQTDGLDGAALAITVAALLTLPVGLPAAFSRASA